MYDFRFLNRPMNLFLVLLMCLVGGSTFAQSAVVTGTVLDAELKYPLPSAYVSISTVDGLMTSTDMDGRFAFDAVPIGRHVVTVSFMGYESRTLDGIVVTSGRPVVLEVQMSESVVAIEAAEVTATQSGEVMNEMATVSARPSRLKKLIVMQDHEVILLEWPATLQVFRVQTTAETTLWYEGIVPVAFCGASRVLTCPTPTTFPCPAQEAVRWPSSTTRPLRIQISSQRHFPLNLETAPPLYST
jgi:hypothetical protein